MTDSDTKSINDDNNNKINEKISDEFRQKVLKYIEYDDKISELQKKIKELKLKKQECEEHILTNMDKLDLNIIEVKNSKIIKNKSESKLACKPDLIKAVLEEEFKDLKRVDKFMEKLEDSREIREKISLRRKKN